MIVLDTFAYYMIKITGILRTFTSRLGFGLNCLGVIVCLGKCFTISNNTIEVGVGVLGTWDLQGGLVTFMTYDMFSTPCIRNVV